MFLKLSKRRYPASVLALAAATPLLALLAAWVGARSVNYVSAWPALHDSGIFASTGYHLRHGFGLYRDVWDQKPPVVHLLNAVGAESESMDGVRRLEQVFGAARGAAFFLIALALTRRRTIAAVFTTFFLLLFYDHPLFEGGNLTEEYASLFALLGMGCAMRAAAVARSETPYGWAAAAGFWFGLAALTKEPFALSAVPWVVYLLVQSWHAPGRARGSLAAFVIGGAVPVVAVALLLAVRGCLLDWLDTISFNFGYAGAEGWSPWRRPLEGARMVRTLFAATSVTATAACLVGWLATADRAFERQTRWVPAALAGALAADFVGALLSGRRFGHYYMQLVPAFALMGAVGAAYLNDRMGDRRRLARAGLPLLAAACVLLWDFRPLTRWVSRIAMPFRTPEPTALDAYVREHTGPDDAIWAPQGPTGIYFDTERCSPTRYLYLYPFLIADTWRSSAGDKCARIRRDLEGRPPRLLILPEECGAPADALRYLGADTADWIGRHYTRREVFPGEIRPHVVYAWMDAKRDPEP